MRNVSGRSAIPITQVVTKLEAGGTSQGGGEGDEAAAVVAFDHILVLLWIASILRKTAPGQKTGRIWLYASASHMPVSRLKKIWQPEDTALWSWVTATHCAFCREELGEVLPLSLIS